MNSKIAGSVAQLTVGIGALCFVYFEFLETPTPDLKSLLWAVFFLFAPVLITDRIGELVESFLLSRQTSQVQSVLDHLPRLLLNNSNIITFRSGIEARRYCVIACTGAVAIKNTTLRYGATCTAALDDRAYASWREAKKNSILSHSCTWTEIVSCHLSEHDPQQGIMRAAADDGFQYYSAKFIDDKNHPMMQVIIFDRGDKEKEAIFGWEFPGCRHGQAFLTNNERLVEYLERYFDHHYEKVATGGAFRVSTIAG